MTPAQTSRPGDWLTTRRSRPYPPLLPPAAAVAERPSVSPAMGVAIEPICRCDRGRSAPCGKLVIRVSRATITGSLTMANMDDSDDSASGHVSEHLRAVLELAVRMDTHSGAVVADDPEVRETAERQRRVAALLGSGGPAVPKALRGRLDEGRRQRRRVPAPPRLPAWGSWSVGLTGAAAMAIALLVVLGTFGG